MLNPGHNSGEASSWLVDLPDGDETMGPTMEDAARLSALSAPSAPPAPKTYALPTAWEQHKDKIRRLYLDENKPLREVMTVLHRDHGHFGRYVRQRTNELSSFGTPLTSHQHQTVQEQASRVEVRYKVQETSDLSEEKQ